MKYWIIVASKDHIQRGQAGGFIQANHGKAAPLKRMHAGDWVIFYSPKLEYDKPEKCQCFTAIVRVWMRKFINKIWVADLSRFG